MLAQAPPDQRSLALGAHRPMAAMPVLLGGKGDDHLRAPDQPIVYSVVDIVDLGAKTIEIRAVHHRLFHGTMLGVMTANK